MRLVGLDLRLTGLAFFFLPRHFLLTQILTSERTFSAAGNLVCEKGIRLSWDSIQANMTLRSWRIAELIK